MASDESKDSHGALSRTSSSSSVGENVVELKFDTDIPVLPVRTEKQLSDIFAKIKSTLHNKASTWKEQRHALHQLVSVVKGGAESNKQFKPLILGLRGPLADLLHNPTTKVVLETCTTLAFLSRFLHEPFSPVADFMIPVLLTHAQSVNNTTSQACDKCIRTLIADHQLKESPQKIIRLCRETGDRIRLKSTEYLLLMLESQSTEVLRKSLDELETVLQQLLDDRHERIRFTARHVYYAYKKRFPSRPQHFIQDTQEHIATLLTIDEERGYMESAESREKQRTMRHEKRAIFKQPPRRRRSQMLLSGLPASRRQIRSHSPPPRLAPMTGRSIRDIKSAVAARPFRSNRRSSLPTLDPLGKRHARRHSGSGIPGPRDKEFGVVLDLSDPPSPGWLDFELEDHSLQGSSNFYRRKNSRDASTALSPSTLTDIPLPSVVEEKAAGSEPAVITEESGVVVEDVDANTRSGADASGSPRIVPLGAEHGKLLPRHRGPPRSDSSASSNTGSRPNSARAVK